MAAEMKIYSMHAGGDTTSPADHIRFKLADNDTADTASPCRIPTADQVAAQIPATWSFRKCLKLFSHIGPTNSISNLRFFLDGNELGTGIVLHGDMTTNAAATGAHAPESSDSTGNSDNTCHWMVVTGANAWTKASPLVVAAGTVWSAAETGDGGTDQPFVLLQTRILPTASPGIYPDVPSKGVISYRYDEN